MRPRGCTPCPPWNRSARRRSPQRRARQRRKTTRRSRRRRQSRRRLRHHRRQRTSRSRVCMRARERQRMRATQPCRSASRNQSRELARSSRRLVVWVFLRAKQAPWGRRTATVVAEVDCARRATPSTRSEGERLPRVRMQDGRADSLIVAQFFDAAAMNMSLLPAVTCAPLPKSTVASK